MVLPSNIIIKQEKEDYEHEAGSIEPNYEFNIKLEVETSTLHEETDWCIENRFLHENKFCKSLNNDEVISPCSEDSDTVVDYQELIEYNKQKCTMCKSQFYESYSRLRHNLSHLKLQLHRITQKKYQCNACLRYFMRKESLEHHIIQQHIEKETKPNQFENDNDNFCKSKILHQCFLCGKIMPYKSWHSHMNEVHGQRKFECPICNSMFKSKRYLTRHHMYVHAGVSRPRGTVLQNNKPPLDEVKCMLCPAVLRDKHALKTHMRNCHCEKVECDICHSVLKKAYLKNHIRRVHYNDGKDYKCECGKTFHSPRYLRVHLKNTQGRCKTKKKKSPVKKSKKD